MRDVQKVTSQSFYFLLILKNTNLKNGKINNLLSNILTLESPSGIFGNFHFSN